MPWGWEDAEEAWKVNGLKLPQSIQALVDEAKEKEGQSSTLPDGLDEKKSLFQKGVGGPDDWMVLHWMPLGGLDLDLEEPPDFIHSAEVVIEAGDLCSPLPPLNQEEEEGGCPTAAAAPSTSVTEAPTPETQSHIKGGGVVNHKELTAEIERMLSSADASSSAVLSSAVNLGIDEWEGLLGSLISTRDISHQAEDIGRLICAASRAGCKSLGMWALSRALPRHVQAMQSNGNFTDITCAWGIAKVSDFVSQVVRWSFLGSLPPAEFRVQLQALGLRSVGDIGASLEALIAEEYFNRR